MSTVRDSNDTDKTAHLHAIAEEAGGGLALVGADLLQRGSFDEAVAGV